MKKRDEELQGHKRFRLDKTNGLNLYKLRIAKRTVFTKIQFGVLPVNGNWVLSGDSRFTHKIMYKEYNGPLGTGTMITIACSDEQHILDLRSEYVLLHSGAAAVRISLANCSTQNLYLQTIRLIMGTVRVIDAHIKILINREGVFELPEGEQAGGKFAVAVHRPSIAAGFLTGEHNLGSFSVKHQDKKLEFIAQGDCNGCLLLPDAKRISDWVWISGQPDSMKGLEQFAELAGKINRCRIWDPNFATLCSWVSGPKFKQCLNGKLEKFVLDTLPHLDKVALYTGQKWKWLRVVDDSLKRKTGDWPEQTDAVPHGYRELQQRMNKYGFKLGYWTDLFYVQTETELFSQHPDWLALNEKGEPAVSDNPYYGKVGAPDLSVSEMQKYIRTVGARLKDWGISYVMTDFTDSGLHGGKEVHNPTWTSMESLRAGYKAFRKGIGPGIYWMGNMLPQAAMGLVDGVRTGADVWYDDYFGYMQAASSWWAHRRLWLCDPDAVQFRGMGHGINWDSPWSTPLDWERAWASWVALSGYVVTYGIRAIDCQDLEPVLKDIFKRLMPPMSVAGRPMDLWENQPHICWNLPLQTGEESYHILGVFHWLPDCGGKVKINIDRIFDACPGEETSAAYLVYDFWANRFLGVSHGEVEVDLPHKAGQVLGLRLVTGRPQVVGTTSHIGQGYLELSDIKWDESKGELSGRSRGIAGRATSLVFYVPPNYRLNAFEVNGKRRIVPMLDNDVYICDLDDLEREVNWVIRAIKLREPNLPDIRRVRRGKIVRVTRSPKTQDFYVDYLRQRSPERFLSVETSDARVHAYVNCGNATDVPYSSGMGFGYEKGTNCFWSKASTNPDIPEWVWNLRTGPVVHYRVDRLVSGKSYRLGLLLWDEKEPGRKMQLRLRDGKTGVMFFEKNDLITVYTMPEEGFPLTWVRFTLPDNTADSIVIELAAQSDSQQTDGNAVISEIWLLAESGK